MFNNQYQVSYLAKEYHDNLQKEAQKYRLVKEAQTIKAKRKLERKLAKLNVRGLPANVQH